MKRNSKIHFWIETEIKEIIKKKAKEDNLSLSEYCRDIIRDNLKSLKLENMIERILEILDKDKFK